MPSNLKPAAQGDWYPALSGQSVPAALFIENSRIRLVAADGEKLCSAELGDVSISARVGRIARRLALPDGSQFVTDDNDAIDALDKARSGKWNGAVHRLERLHPRLIGLALAIIMLGAAIYRYALPVLVEIAVRVTPPVAAEYMTKGTMQALDRAVFSPSALSIERQAALTRQFEEIAAFSPSGAGKFNLNFREGGFIGPNAFALPDGNVVITDELVALAGDDDEMILGALAHEMGHVEKQHSLRQLYRAAGVAGLIMMIGGDIGEGAQDALVQGGGLLVLSFSRQAESEADRHSVEVMMKAGRDPVAISRFFEMLEEALGDRSESSMLSTHPGTPERKLTTQAYAKELAARPAP